MAQNVIMMLQYAPKIVIKMRVCVLNMIERYSNNVYAFTALEKAFNPNLTYEVSSLWLGGLCFNVEFDKFCIYYFFVDLASMQTDIKPNVVLNQ